MNLFEKQSDLKPVFYLVPYLILFLYIYATYFLKHHIFYKPLSINFISSSYKRMLNGLDLQLTTVLVIKKKKKEKTA